MSVDVYSGLAWSMRMAQEANLQQGWDRKRETEKERGNKNGGKDREAHYEQWSGY